MFRKLLLVIIKATCIHESHLQAYLSISVLAFFFYLHAKNLPFMSFESLKLRKKRCKEVSANDQLELGTMAAGILILTVALINEREQHPILGGLVIFVIFAVGALIVYYCYRAYNEQQKEETAMAKEGMFNDNRMAMNTMMGGAG